MNNRTERSVISAAAVSVTLSQHLGASAMQRQPLALVDTIPRQAPPYAEHYRAPS